MKLSRRNFIGIVSAALVAFALPPELRCANVERAFPGAEGWTATVGGRGGKILRVATLVLNGTGSFLEALNAKGPRIIVFQVGGGVDLPGQCPGIKGPFVSLPGRP